MVNIIQRWLFEHKASAIWSILYRDGCFNIKASVNMGNIIQRWLLEQKASAIWSILYRDGCLNMKVSAIW